MIQEQIRVDPEIDYVLKLTDLQLTEIEDTLRAESTFYEFFKQAWPFIEGDKPYVDGWHIEAICEHIQALVERKIKKLLINLPPRAGKSSIIAVSLCAWRWLNRPSEQFLYTSYALSLSMRDQNRCRRLIQSPWYQKRWGDIFQLTRDQNTKYKFENNHKGFRIASSISGTTTGEGGSVIIMDDPNNAKEVSSALKLQRAIDFVSQVWSSRLNDKKNDCQLIVQQRIDQNDISGYVLSNDVSSQWVKLILPMEYDSSYASRTIVLPSTPNKPWEDPRQVHKELLWPGAIGEKELEDLKLSLGSIYTINAQLQQRPNPPEGTLIKKDWFPLWKDPLPNMEFVIQSWDLSLTPPNPSKTSSYSACTTWGIFFDEVRVGNIMLLSLWRDKIEYPELRERVKRLYYNYTDTGSKSKFKGFNDPSVDLCLIEAKAIGDSLIQDLRLAGIVAQPFIPKDDKLKRVKLVSHLIEAGRVWLPTRSPHYKTITEEAEVFLNCVINLHPILNKGYDGSDVVDTMSQAFIKIKDTHLVQHPRDFNPAPSYQKEYELYKL